MKRLVVCAIAAALVGWSVPHALAKEKPERQTKEDVQSIDFTKDEVQEIGAEVMRPDQSVADVLLMGRRGSLIKERKDFVEEILRSAEDL